MKRAMYALLLGLMVTGLYGLNPRGNAQVPASPASRNDAVAVLHKFVDAGNQDDMLTMMGLISTHPDVSFIIDGNIYRGHNEIQNHQDQLLGLQGKYQYQLGAMGFATINGTILATGPYLLQIKGQSGGADLKGAVTFILEKQGKNWLIAHMHSSLAEVDVQASR
jgi:hypothetical protein